MPRGHAHSGHEEPVLRVLLAEYNALGDRRAAISTITSTIITLILVIIIVANITIIIISIIRNIIVMLTLRMIVITTLAYITMPDQALWHIQAHFQEVRLL